MVTQRFFLFAVILLLQAPLLAESAEQDLTIFNMDFDVSMGKNDPFMHKHYKAFKKALKNPHRNSFFSYITPHSAQDFLDLCKRLYEKNKTLSKNSDIRIPRIFHQIWVGKKPFPEKYKKWQKTWQSMPGWSYKLWTDEDVEKLDFPRKDIYNQETNMAAKADILRTEILYLYGGVYIDTDLECLKPEYFDVLNRSYDFYTGINPLDTSAFVLNNAIIASVPHHPIMKACSEQRLKVATKKGFHYFNIINNGLGQLTKMVLLHADKGYRDIILPPTFFYPISIHQIERYSRIANKQERFEKMKRDSFKPEGIAVHWWDGSWY